MRNRQALRHFLFTVAPTKALLLGFLATIFAGTVFAQEAAATNRSGVYN